jgi:hypothetical protein
MAEVEHELYTDVHGATILSVDGFKSGSSVLTIYTDKGAMIMQHHQDCCESVHVEDVCGDPDALVGARIVEFRESTKDDDNPGYGDGRWTFYHIITTREDLTIRWYGSSNGYYSISVSCSLQADKFPAPQEFVKVDPLTFPEGSGLRLADVDEPTSQAKEVAEITAKVFRSKVYRVLSKYSACVEANDLGLVSIEEVVEDLTALMEEC